MTSRDEKLQKAKAEGEIKNMKNRNIQFKTTARLLIPLFLACFAAGVYLGAAPAVSPRHGPVQRDCLGYNYFDCASGRDATVLS